MSAGHEAKARTSRADFYQDHLDRVSRSFAFCIARLDSPLREQIGLGYLLCRIVDTIEDAPWPDFSSQESAFETFDYFLRKAPSAAEAVPWLKTFPGAIPESERLLLQDAVEIFVDFHELPPAARANLRAPIQSMSAGMREFMRRKAREGRLKLRDAADVNKYCFFVAGVVGEMLTGLLRLEAGSRNVALNVALPDAFRFGLFLQKINLLKDQAGDERVGRFLVPSRRSLRASVATDADCAFRYLLSLPIRFESFRLFCAWSLFLGLASLPWIDRSALGEDGAKIPRDETLVLLGRVESVIGDDKELSQLFHELRDAALIRARVQDEQTSRSLGPSGSEIDFYSLYRGELSAPQVRDLFEGN